MCIKRTKRPPICTNLVDLESLLKTTFYVILLTEALKLSEIMQLTWHASSTLKMLGLTAGFNYKTLEKICSKYSPQ